MGKQRIEFIDAIKGLSILWVFLYHFKGVGYFIDWSWIDVKYRMSLFFFLSGIFFRIKPFKEFFLTRINTLIVPFLVFWFFGELYEFVKYDFISSFFRISFIGDYSFIEHIKSIVGVFELLPNLKAFGANIPIWFLFSLFLIQMFYYLNVKFIKNKYIILLIAISFHLLGYILENKTNMELSYQVKILKFYIYYVLGNIIGPNLLKYFEKKKTCLYLSFICLPLLIGLSLINDNFSKILFYCSFEIKFFSFFILIFIFFKNFSHYKLFNPLKFFGKHSLEILVTHEIVLMLWVDIKDNFVSINLFEGKLIYEIILFVILLVVEYFVILFLNRFFPRSIGRKPLFPIIKKNIQSS